MKQQNKHIVILTPGFPENEADTTCIPALQIYVKALRDISDCDITVISIHKPFQNKTYYWNDITVHAIGGASLFSKIFHWKKVYKALKQVHQKKQIDVLHSFWLSECALLGHRFSEKKGIRHLTTLMGQDALKKNRYAKLLPLKKMLLVTLSDFHRHTFYSNYEVATNIIPWGISPADFQISDDKTVDIISVGYLNQLKNHDLFIDIVHKLSRDYPIKAVLVGEGILEEQLRKKVASLRLENTIEIKGLLDYEETLKSISNSKILLHTSNYESFGLVFAEALQSKTLVVSRNIGCAFPSSNWVIAETEDEMVSACQELLSRPFSEDERNPFLIEKTVQRYLELYDK